MKDNYNIEVDRLLSGCNFNTVKTAAAGIEYTINTYPALKGRIKEFKVKEIKKMNDGSYILTAPEMITGWAKIRFDVPKDTVITVTYMEQLKKDGTFQKIGKGEGRDGNWWPEDYIQHDTFISNGEECFFEPKFSYKGFKYIEISGCPTEITIDDIVLYKIASDVEFISEFSCSNSLINDFLS